MGNKGAKVPPKAKLSSKELKNLSKQTGLPEEKIKALFDQFNANNPDGRLDRQEFIRLYDQLRSEPLDKLDEISQFVFGAFDKDRNGFISFGEFLIAFVLTSRGEPQQKLEFAFTLYDADGNGTLDRNEVQNVLFAMLDLLGAEKRNYNVAQLTQECMKNLDTSGDGKISQSEFINGLLANYSLKALMSPFN